MDRFQGLEAALWGKRQWRKEDGCFSRHGAWRSKGLAHLWRGLFSRAAGGELSLRDLGVRWCCHIPVAFGLSGGRWLALILVQKLCGKKTVFSKSLYFILNHQLLLWAGSTFFQRALDVAILWHCFLEEKNFSQGLSEVGCCAPSLLVPSAPFGVFAWQRVELLTNSSGSQERFQLLPFPFCSTQSSRPEGWGWQVLLCANRGYEICCQPGTCTWLQVLVVLRVSLACDVPS